MKVTGSVLAGATLAATASQTACASAPGEKPVKKALKFGMVKGNSPILEKFKLLKEVGFDGVELDSPSQLDRQEVLEASEETGLKIPGVIDAVHWDKPLSDSDSAVRKVAIEALETALRDAKAYGSDTVLLVPAVVDKVTSYDDAYTRSQEQIRKVLPLAEELKITLWPSVASANNLTSSGITNSRPYMAAQAWLDRANAKLPRGLAPR